MYIVASRRNIDVHRCQHWGTLAATGQDPGMILDLQQENSWQLAPSALIASNISTSSLCFPIHPRLLSESALVLVLDLGRGPSCCAIMLRQQE